MLVVIDLLSKVLILASSFSSEDSPAHVVCAGCASEIAIGRRFAAVGTRADAGEVVDARAFNVLHRRAASRHCAIKIAMRGVHATSWAHKIMNGHTHPCCLDGEHRALDANLHGHDQHSDPGLRHRADLRDHRTSTGRRGQLLDAGGCAPGASNSERCPPRSCLPT